MARKKRASTSQLTSIEVLLPYMGKNGRSVVNRLRQAGFLSIDQVEHLSDESIMSKCQNFGDVRMAALRQAMDIVFGRRVALPDTPEKRILFSVLSLHVSPKIDGFFRLIHDQFQYVDQFAQLTDLQMMNKAGGNLTWDEIHKIRVAIAAATGTEAPPRPKGTDHQKASHHSALKAGS
ncbi:MAG: hypothetical protein KGI37_04220 [Alphaproteobacteria bacterium]|nr:hypothetical protein [Alphaproteobacteria bacterium]